MTNNLGRVETSVGQTGKETSLNNSDARLDAAITGTLTLTWSGADSLKTVTTAQMQQAVNIIMAGSTSDTTPTLKLADVQRGVILITNNLANILTVEDYTSSETVPVGIGLTVAMYSTPTGLKQIYTPVASGGSLETLADGPGTFAGAGLKLVRINAAATAFEFVNSIDIDLLHFKKACRAATTANITIATALNNGDSLDGVTLATGDRVLVKNQSTGSENGIYVVDPTPFRALDFDADAEVKGGLIVAVSEGTIGGNAAYMLTTNDAIVVGTTALVFSTFGGGGGGAFLNLSDVPGNYTADAKKKVRVNAGETALEFVPDTRNACGSFGGAIPTSVVVFAWMPVIAMQLAASLAGSRVFAKTAATAQTDFDVRKNGASIGTIRFAASGTVASYVGIAAVTLDGVDDYFEVVSPGTADATLQELFFSFLATAND